jgi:hypothetical protein
VDATFCVSRVDRENFGAVFLFLAVNILKLVLLTWDCRPRHGFAVWGFFFVWNRFLANKQIFGNFRSKLVASKEGAQS